MKTDDVQYPEQNLDDVLGAFPSPAGAKEGGIFTSRWKGRAGR